MLQIMHIVLANHFLIKIKSTVVLKTSTYIYKNFTHKLFLQLQIKIYQYL